ncbi:MAG: motility associated factor glycosyltransferase family protein [Clostridia bacterium]|nr:motility associated factor glycosyltransferase family protein [Clostridia bacterium]
MSNQLLKENLDIIREYHPLLDAMFQSENISVRADIQVGIEEVCDKKVLFARMGEETFQLDTLYDSNELVNLWFDHLGKIYLNAKLLIFGLGNGMFVRKLLECTSEDVRVIVYEPNLQILSKVIEEFDLTDILRNQRLLLIVEGMNNNTIEENYYGELNYTDLETFIYRSYLNYNRLYQNEYFAYMEALQNVCSSINSTQDVIGRYGEIYYQNTFQNMDFFIKSKSLQNLYQLLPKDVPAIIVAAGPSLDKNVTELKKAKGKAFIVAVDTALTPLIKSGIIPDICISIDGKKQTWHFKDPATHEIPLVCYLLSHAQILKEHTAEKFFLNDINHHVQHFLSGKNKVLPIISSGGSVANDAFSLVQLLGFTTIILIGQDLALTGNKSHADATLCGQLKWTADRFDDLIEVEGIDGKPVLSKGEYRLYCRWFEEQIRKYPELKVIDATEGGAKIHGTLIQTLSETIEEECKKEVDFQNIIARTQDYFSDEEKTDFIQYLLKLPEEMETALKDVKKGIADYIRMQEIVYKDKYRGNELKKLFQETSQIGERLEANPALDYVRNRIQQQTTDLLKTIYMTEEDERSELLAGCQKGIQYLKIMEQDLIKVIPDIRAKLERYKNE